MNPNQLEAPERQLQKQFVRDHLIWIYYSFAGLNCYVISALGPIMPFLRSELSLNYQLAGMHFSSLALGTIAAGFSGDRVVNRLGRVRSLWFSVLGTIFGVLCLITGHQATVTIFGILVSGFCIALTYQTLATAISDHLEEMRTFAFVESEVAAMFGALIAPFAVGGFVSVKLGWRAALIVAILTFAFLLPSLNQFGPIRTAAVSENQGHGRLPLAFWSYALVIFLSVSAEWSTAFWSAGYLHETLLISKAEAAAAVGSFFVGMVIGRLSGTRLVRVHSPAKLLVLSSIVSIVGFSMFWLAHLLIINVAGLFLTGLGIANMYPLSFSAAVGAASGQTSKAIARVSLMCGTAILAAPFSLSFVADRAGLFAGYSMTAVVLLFCAASIIWANRLAKRQMPHKENDLSNQSHQSKKP